MLHEHILNADFLNHSTRDNCKHNFVAAMVGNSMLHQTIVNATLQKLGMQQCCRLLNRFQNPQHVAAIKCYVKITQVHNVRRHRF